MGHLSEHGSVVEAFWLGRDPHVGQSILEVAAWLDSLSVEGGWIRSSGEAQVVAFWLLRVRAHVERRKLGWG